MPTPDASDSDVTLDSIGVGKDKKPEFTTAQWWRCHEQEDQKPHEVLDKLVDLIEQDQTSRYDAYKEYSRMFGNSSDVHGDDRTYAMMHAASALTQNELANTIETLWAQVFKNRIVPTPAVSESDYDEWVRAKGCRRWIEGAFDSAGVFSMHAPSAGLGALIDGTGAVKVYWEQDPEEEKVALIRCQALPAKYLMVDRHEARHGQPRSFFQKEYVDKWRLWELYKDEEDGFYGSVADRLKGILECTDYDDLEVSKGFKSSDVIRIREAWHLPSSAKAKDGRHVIWIRGCTLVDEPFEWSQFPFEFLKFGATREGFWGESAVARIAPTQKLLDKLNQKIDEAQDVMGVPRIIVQKGSGLVKAHVDDIPGGILECDNIGGIRDWNAQCASQELYQDRDGAPRKMRSLLGVSDMDVAQQVPQGMRDVSGSFLERWVEQGQARHAMFHSAYEDFICRLAMLFIRVAEDAQEHGYDVVVQSPGEQKSSIQILKFSEIAMDRKKMKFQVLPMSQLPNTFAGKVEALEKLKALMPNLPDQTVARMTEIPDINGTTDLMVSDEEIIMKNINFMIKKGEYLPPLPFDNHELIIMLTTKFINSYRVKEDVDHTKVGILVRYIEAAKAFQDGLGGQDPNAPPPPMAPPGPPGPMGMGPPPGPPMPGMPMGPPPGPPAMPPPPPAGPPPGPPMGPPPGPMGPPMM